MIVSLLFVIFLIMMIAYLNRKRQRKSRFMNIIEYLSIGTKKGVAAVKVGRDILILGVTPTGFNLLTTMDEERFKDISDFYKIIKEGESTKT